MRLIAMLPKDERRFLTAAVQRSYPSGLSGLDYFFIITDENGFMDRLGAVRMITQLADAGFIPPEKATHIAIAGCQLPKRLRAVVNSGSITYPEELAKFNIRLRAMHPWRVNGIVWKECPERRRGTSLAWWLPMSS